MTKERITFGSKVIGEIDYEKKCFVTFKNDRHYFRNFDGFGASIKLLDYLQEKGIDLFIVNFNNQDFYWTEIASFIVKGKEWTDGDDDHQLILHISHWNLYDFNRNIIPIKYKKACATVFQNPTEVIGTQNETQGTL